MAVINKESYLLIETYSVYQNKRSLLKHCKRDEYQNIKNLKTFLRLNLTQWETALAQRYIHYIYILINFGSRSYSFTITIHSYIHSYFSFWILVHHSKYLHI